MLLLVRCTYKYRLYPNQAQVEFLENQLHEACDLYNAALQERRDAWKVCRKSINYYDQAKQLKPMREEGLLGLANFSCCQISEELCQVENLIFSTGPTSLPHVFCTHISHDATASFVAATSGELCLAKAAR